VINRTANFNSNILYRGANTQSSYSQKYLEEIQNNNDLDPNSIAGNYPFGTSLAFNTYWIDTANGWNAGNKQFVSLAAPLLAGEGLLQEQKVTNRGGITELGLAGAVNYNEKFFIGGTLGISLLHYKRQSTFLEADATADENGFDFASVSENLTTNGIGINLKLGAIYKPSESIRLGLAIHTPSYYTLTDKYNTSITTNTENYQGQWNQSSDLFSGGEDAEFKYSLLTPYKIMGSVSYVLREIEDVRKQKGFITADIEYVNYKSSSFSTVEDGDQSQATRDYLKSLNKAIDLAYKGALNFRVGGELKFTTLMVRLGGAYYGNPYKDIAGEKGHRFQLTGGLGYRDKGFFIDVAYVHTMGKDVHYAYRLQNAPYTGATIKSTVGTAVLTVGFKI
jgi:long-subunit fatty acid transport protein